MQKYTCPLAAGRAPLTSPSTQTSSANVRSRDRPTARPSCATLSTRGSSFTGGGGETAGAGGGGGGAAAGGGGAETAGIGSKSNESDSPRLGGRPSTVRPARRRGPGRRASSSLAPC